MASRVAKTLARAVSCADAAPALTRADAALAALPFSRALAALPFSHADAASLAGALGKLTVPSFRDPNAGPTLSPRQPAVSVSLTNAAPLAGARGLLTVHFRDPDFAPAQSPRKPTVGSLLGTYKIGRSEKASHISSTQVLPRWISTRASNVSSDQQTSKSAAVILQCNYGSPGQQGGGSSTGIGPIGPDGLPIAVDWVAIGAVTAVSDQGSCGACWAFASTVGTEGINFIVTGYLLKLSEQQLIDCVRTNCFGCNGGIPDAAFEYIIANRGQVTFQEYPYVGVQNLVHNRIWSPFGVTIDGYRSYFDVDEATLKRFVANQPVVVAVGADQSFETYTNGVLDGKNYTVDELNERQSGGSRLGHWVAIVAYGEDTHGKKFWKIKNSHGGNWGEGGYMCIARDTGKEGGAFGICRFVSFPIKHSPNRLCVVRNEEELGITRWNF